MKPIEHFVADIGYLFDAPLTAKQADGIRNALAEREAQVRMKYGPHIRHCGFDTTEGELAGCKYGDADCPMMNSPVVQALQREAQVRAEEREKVAGLVEALEAFEFKQYQGRDEKPIGWLMLRPSVPKGRGGVNITFQEPEMLEALQNWYEERLKALATYNDNRKG
jgi:hypothetical protein